MLMITAVLAALGLCLGSFVNALVWRVRQQETAAKGSKELSVMRGRSICPQCRHKLSARDLVPLLSWLALRGKCRYCGKAISMQYPLVEAATMLLFIISYSWWPETLTGLEWLNFGLWLVILTGLVALFVYDLKWFLLPNKIMFPLIWLAGLRGVFEVLRAGEPLAAFLSIIGAVAVGGGIFYVIYQVSQGNWIGGGDVKLGWLLGLVVGTPGASLLFIFLAALLGSLISLPLLATKRLRRHSLIPFGPFLIAGGFVAVLFGENILEWYRYGFLGL